MTWIDWPSVKIPYNYVRMIYDKNQSQPSNLKVSVRAHHHKLCKFFFLVLILLVLYKGFMSMQILGYFSRLNDLI